MQMFMIYAEIITELNSLMLKHFNVIVMKEVIPFPLSSIEFSITEMRV